MGDAGRSSGGGGGGILEEVEAGVERSDRENVVVEGLEERVVEGVCGCDGGVEWRVSERERKRGVEGNDGAGGMEDVECMSGNKGR